VRPPKSQAPIPWTLSPNHEPIPHAHRSSCPGLHTAEDAALCHLVWHRGDQLPPSGALLDIRIVRLSAVTVVPILRRRGNRTASIRMTPTHFCRVRMAITFLTPVSLCPARLFHRVPMPPHSSSTLLLPPSSTSLIALSTGPSTRPRKSPTPCSASGPGGSVRSHTILVVSDGTCRLTSPKGECCMIPNPHV
jgi:hypothetical protein